MKTTSSSLLTSPRRRRALRIARTDGQVFGFTEGDAPAVIGGVTYGADQGLLITDIENAEGLAVGNLTLTTLDDGSLFTAADVAGGRWTNAAWLIFVYDWANPTAEQEPILSGTLGEIERRRGTLVIELNDIRQYLQQAVGNVSTKTCRARFADYPTPNGNNRCRLSAAAWTVAGTVTAVTDARRQFTAAGLTQADDWFAEGVVTWVTGNLAGQSGKVKAFSTGGQVTLLLPTILPIQVGDTFSVLAGCRKRLDEDCATKFGNEPNFAGEPHRPTTDQLTATSTPDV